MEPGLRTIGPKPAMKSSPLAKEGHTLGSEFSRTQSEEHSTTAQEAQCPREKTKPAVQRSSVLLRLRSQKSASNALELSELSGGSSWWGGGGGGEHCIM